MKEQGAGPVLGYECRFRRKDGSLVWVSLNSRIVCSPDGKPLYHEGSLIDITPRKQAEESLRESGDFLKQAQKFGNLGCYVFDITSDAWTCSEVMDEIFGIDKNYPHTLQGWTALIHPHDRDMMAAYFQNEVVGQRKDFDKEYRIVRISDHVERWVHGTGGLEFDAQSQPLKMHGIIKDITDRKLAEMQLRESEASYRSTFEQAAVGIVHATFEGVILHYNARFAAPLGYTAGELNGVNVREITAPEDRALSLEAMQRILGGVTVTESMEKRYLRKDASQVWVKMTLSLQRDAEGRALRFIAIVEDINDRKIAEQRLANAMEALRLSETHYRTVFQTTPDAVVIARVADGAIIDANRAFLDSSRFKRSEVIGRNSLDLGIWVDPADRQTLHDALFRTGECRDLNVRSRRKNGEIFWMSLSASLIEIGGVQCTITFAKDITEAKVAEERLAEASKALRASEQRYRTVFLMNSDAVDICHLEDGRFIDVNDAFVACTGFKRDQVIGRTALELGIWANPGDRNQLLEIIRRDGSCRNLEVQYHTNDGSLRWGLLTVSAIELDGVPCILSVTRDITEAKAAEERLAAAQEALRASEERYRATFQLSIDAININRLSDGVFVDVNEAFLQFVGFEREEVIGRTSQELNFWVDPGVRQQMVETLKRGESCRDLEARFRRKNGEIVWGQASESILEIDGIPCILSVTRNISAAKAAEEQIRDLAFYDPLTHMPNRRLLMERLRQSLVASSRTNRKRALLFVDLDNFKTLNDTLGHQTGDLLLQEVGVRLAACIRESDTVARLGGDEFVVMLEDLSDNPEEAATQAELVAEKILAAVDLPFWLSGRECLSTSSIGITVFGDKRESTDEVLQQADIAMYQAKAAGRNTMRFFAPALQAAVNARAALEEDIRQGIKFGQFELYYQPQLGTIGLVGAEALIRWNHPRRGLLLPGEFIHLSEETGLIMPLGDWVLENAFAQVAAWAGRPETSHISLAINISARQFRQTGFVDKVLVAIDRTGANPQNIKLELTESMLVENIEDVIAKMTALKSHGLKFSLDDFGTGYSSLSYLKRLPLDQLKIDSSFVRDILADVGSRAIAQSVISLGHALGLSVIAECVETEEQRDLLSSIGCHAFQGFLFSRALPLDDFERQWLCSSEFIIP